MGARVVRPAARSAKLTMMTTSAAAQSEIDLVRELIPAFCEEAWPAPESIISAVV